MKVVLSPKAEKELKKIPKIDQIAIVRKIRILSQDQNELQEEKLEGFSAIFRVRIGNYRIVYKKTQSQVYIIIIRHRRDVYRLLQQLFK